MARATARPIRVLVPEKTDAQEIRYVPRVVYERFTLSQRIQHIVLILSFALLMFTGLPLLTPDVPVFRKLLSFPGGFQLRGLLHRAGAVTLMGLAVYHLLYSLFSERGGRDVREMILRRKDWRDFRHFLAYRLGRRPDPPRYGRFNWIEKFEYLSVVWGTVVMTASGLVLWQEEAAMAVFPKWVIDVAAAVHGYEAILAFLAIILWHLYTVHLNPEVFPMNKVWLTGKLTEEEMERHHPLELEALRRGSD
jgi:formate dehydrogenase gamma subunit